MRRVIALIASLYPRSWRERYGEEFAALLDDVAPSPRAALNTFRGALFMHIRTWSRGWIFAVSALCTCGAFVAALHFVSGDYISRGILGVDSAEPPQAIGDSVYGFDKAVESREALTYIITSEHLYEQQRTRKLFEDVLNQMRRDIKVEPMRRADGSLAAISVAFDYPEPRTAQRVTDKLLASFVDQSNGAATTLKVLDAAELPKGSTHNLTLIAANAGVLVGLLTLALLFGARHLMARKA